MNAYDVPSMLDNVVRDARATLAKVRHDFGCPEDFEHYVSAVLDAALADYSPAVRAYTVRTIFGDRRNMSWLAKQRPSLATC